jgi:hypothetical protein
MVKPAIVMQSFVLNILSIIQKNPWLVQRGNAIVTTTPSSHAAATTTTSVGMSIRELLLDLNRFMIPNQVASWAATHWSTPVTTHAAATTTTTVNQNSSINIILKDLAKFFE